MRLPKLHDDDKVAKKLRVEGLLESLEDIKKLLHYQSFPYVSKNICSELINRYHKNLLAGHFGIEKT